MQMFHASVEVDAPAFTRDDRGFLAQLVDEVKPYHGVPFGSPRGFRGIALTLPAESAAQAATTAAALVRDWLHAEPIVLEVLTETEFDAREGFTDLVPDMMSVTEAAELLQLTRAGIIHRINTNALQAVKVGEGRTSSYVLIRSSVEAAARAAGIEVP